MFKWSIWVILAYIFFGSSALAQTNESDGGLSQEVLDAFERGCGDDQGQDRCDTEAQRKMRELYRIESAEELMAKGVTLRRAMIVDGYGNDVVAVTFSRAPGKSPSVDVAIPMSEGEEQQPLRGNIGAKLWDEVLAASRDFDAKLARELPTAEDDEIIILCLHGWFTVVEAVDAQRYGQNSIPRELRDGKIRRDAEGSCAKGLAVPYAFRLTALALEALPECRRLDPKLGRNTAALLALCAGLRGDRLAAADALQLTKKLEFGGRESEADLRFLFAHSARSKRDQFVQDLAGGSPYFSAPIGLDVDRATVKGSVAYWDGDDDETKNQFATIELELVRETGGFKILSYKISEKRTRAN